MFEWIIVIILLAIFLKLFHNYVVNWYSDEYAIFFDGITKEKDIAKD